MYYEKDNYKNQKNNQLNYNSINPELKQLQSLNEYQFKKLDKQIKSNKMINTIAS